MLLSEAIRLGAMIRPQGFGRLFKQGKSCAFGAAQEATGRPYTESDRLPASYDLIDRWPWLLEKKETECPSCRQHGNIVTGDMVTIIATHLNDRHTWTRERIANWAQQQEQSLGITDQVVIEATAKEVTAKVLEVMG